MNVRPRSVPVFNPPQYSPLTVATPPPPEYVTEDQHQTMPTMLTWRQPTREPALSAAEGSGRCEARPSTEKKARQQGLSPPDPSYPKIRSRILFPCARFSDTLFPDIKGVPCIALASSSLSSFCPALLPSVSHNLRP